MTNEEWKEFVSIVKNNSVEENKTILQMLESGEYRRFNVPFVTKQGLKRFLIERVLYPIGNREQISCNCGSRHGYVVEFEDHKTVYQHTVCMNCDTVQSFDHFDKNIKEEEDQCFAPTNGTWLSRLAQRLLPKAV